MLMWLNLSERSCSLHSCFDSVAGFVLLVLFVFILSVFIFVCFCFCIFCFAHFHLIYLFVFVVFWGSSGFVWPMSVLILWTDSCWFSCHWSWMMDLKPILIWCSTWTYGLRCPVVCWTPSPPPRCQYYLQCVTMSGSKVKWRLWFRTCLSSKSTTSTTGFILVSFIF